MQRVWLNVEIMWLSELLHKFSTKLTRTTSCMNQLIVSQLQS